MAALQDSSSSSNLGVAIVMLTLVLFSVSLRTWSIRLQRLSLDPSFCCVVAAAAFAICSIALDLSMIPEGLDLPLDDRADEPSLSFFKRFYAIQITSTCSLALSKLSVLLFFRKAFPTRAVRIGTSIVGAFVSLWAVVVTLATIFSCRISGTFWSDYVDNFFRQPGAGACIDSRGFFAYSLIPNVVADILVLALPLASVRRLQLNLRDKILVTSVFSVGVIVTLMAIGRLAATAAGNSLGPILTCALAEESLSVVCACLPMLEPVVRRTWPSSGINQSPVTKVDSTDSVSKKSSRLSLITLVASHFKKRGQERRDSSRITARNSGRPHARSLSLQSHEAGSRRSGDGRQTPSGGSSGSTYYVGHRDLREFRRLYEYSGQNEDSQQAFSAMTDNELYGGIEMTQTVQVVEEITEHSVGAELGVSLATPFASNGAAHGPREMV